MTCSTWCQIIFLIIISNLVTAGCKREDPEPEAHDPIFHDLQKRAEDAQKAYDDQVKKQGALESKLKTAEPNTSEKKVEQNDLQKAKNLALDYEQTKRYYELRAKRRLLVDRITYKEAFKKGAVWPNPAEYSDYLLNMHLREVPMDWSKRIPKLQDRLPSSTQSAEKTDTKAEKSQEKKEE